MSRVKKQLFPTTSAKPSMVSHLIEQNILLPIDMAYAKKVCPEGSEKELIAHAAQLSALRMGHLCTDTKSVDPQLIPYIEKGKTLPKYVQALERIEKRVRFFISQIKPPCHFSMNSNLNREQKHAVEMALTHPLTLLTGGPGTGKTYTASAIVEAMQTKTLLTAPTGKAASHLSQIVKTNVICKTLHALLEIKSPLDFYQTPKKLDAELVIVDEATMIDPLLFATLLDAVADHAHIVLMGDPNQLPSVEGGSIFTDLLDTHKVPTAKLIQCMRSERREILDLAKAILENTTQDIRTEDLGFIGKKTKEILEAVWKKVKTKDFNTFRILSTLRKGPLGVDALNSYLFEQFSKTTDRYPILITRNDTQTGLSNGDVGFLENGQADFGEKGSFSKHELPPYEYAYCLSVHKSQWSEYDEVLLLVPEGSEVFGKEVLYTAVTRAKQAISIDGDLDQIEKALNQTGKKISPLKII